MTREKVWTTKEGDDIPYSKIEDSHLLNIKKWIENRADEGMTIGGHGWDIDECWDDEIYGEEVLEYFDYKSILQEIKKRKLI